ncbi:MAG: hypothetical protein U1E78_09595 [Gammaproteobacteria bacterium]
MIFRVGAERSRRRSVHKVHNCGENREGNNPENSAVKGIVPKKPRTGVNQNSMYGFSRKDYLLNVTKCSF